MMVTGEAWDKIFFSAVDAVGQDMEPQSWSSPWSAVYLIGFTLVTNIFIMNLFVGVVIENVKQMKEELREFKELNQAQRDWIDMQFFMQRRKLKVITFKPEGTIRGYCYDIVNYKYFSHIIVAVIFCNTVILGANFATISDEASLVLTILNYVFLVIFHIEAALKIGAWGFSYYFSDHWNK